MPEPIPNTELLRSLGRLARGLSILFWGLPIALVVCISTVKGQFLQLLNVAPPMIALGWLLYGLIQLGHFQPQERIWRAALDRAKFLAITNIGLSPFLYWYNHFPGQPFFNYVVLMLAATGLLFLAELNVVMMRLAAMLPEETLRQETKQFTTLNRVLILCVFVFAFIYIGFLVAVSHQLGKELGQTPAVWEMIQVMRDVRSVIWRVAVALGIFLLLSPLAVTMALIWKTKEVILESVFGGKD